MYKIMLSFIIFMAFIATDELGMHIDVHNMTQTFMGPVMSPVLGVIEKAKNMDGKHGGQCVEFIQRLFTSFYTHPEFRGVAGDIKPNGDVPKIGAVVLLKEGPVGHVALIVDTEKDDLILAESNYSKHNDEIVSVGRCIQKDNERIVGYFNF